jgi:protein SCO1/2
LPGLRVVLERGMPDRCTYNVSVERPGRRAFLATAAAMLAGQVIGPARAHQTKPAPISGFELPQPMPLSPFRLIDHRGAPFETARLAERWTFLLFGFTHCPDVCPTTLVQIAETRRHVASRREGVATAGVFVTIDPARDTRERLARYVAGFGDDLVGVTGKPDDLKAFARQFRIRYTPTSPIGTQSYLFDHTASVSLLGPDARLHAIFSLPLRPEKVAADIARMSAGYKTRGNV